MSIFLYRLMQRANEDKSNKKPDSGFTLIELL